MKHRQREATAHRPSIEEGALIVEVATLASDVAVRATAYPCHLIGTAPEVTAMVVWEGIDVMTSFVGSDADCEPWARCVQLLWAVVGPQTAPVSFEFAADRWTKVSLTAPDVSGDCRQRVVVVLDRAGWAAQLSRPGSDFECVQLEIPIELRSLDAGPLLVHMSCRLLRGIPWT